MRQRAAAPEERPERVLCVRKSQQKVLGSVHAQYSASPFTPTHQTGSTEGVSWSTASAGEDNTERETFSGEKDQFHFVEKSRKPQKNWPCRICHCILGKHAAEVPQQAHIWVCVVAWYAMTRSGMHRRAPTLGCVGEMWPVVPHAG